MLASRRVGRGSTKGVDGRSGARAAAEALSTGTAPASGCGWHLEWCKRRSAAVRRGADSPLTPETCRGWWELPVTRASGVTVFSRRQRNGVARYTRSSARGPCLRPPASGPGDACRTPSWSQRSSDANNGGSQNTSSSMKASDLPASTTLEPAGARASSVCAPTTVDPS